MHLDSEEIENISQFNRKNRVAAVVSRKLIYLSYLTFLFVLVKIIYSSSETFSFRMKDWRELDGLSN